MPVPARRRNKSRRPRARRALLPAFLACCLTQSSSGETLQLSIGVSAAGSPIRAAIDERALDPLGAYPSVLLVAGLDGTRESVDLAAALTRQAPAAGFALSAVLNAFPDRPPVEAFPPPEPAYGGEGVESQYLWRFLGTLAPDLVVDLRADGVPSALKAALDRGAEPADVGRIPARTLRLDAEGRTLESLLAEAQRDLAALAGSLGASPARLEIRSRLERDPVTIALQLEKAYGHHLDSAVYIPALALIGRLRLGDLQGRSRVNDVERIASPFLEGKSSLGERSTGSHLSGHLVFAELHERTGKAAYLDLARLAADFGFDENGALRDSMPFHNQMSDSVFMGCAILARVGRLTGAKRYFRMALRHLRFIKGLDLRPDGLYRHSPLDHAAWNGFPALGLAMAASDWPPSDPGFEEIRGSLESHLRALASHQDPTGAWHQVVDREESYREFTSTAMIGFAIMRGLRRGWLDRREFEPVADRAWRAVQTRIKSDATLVDSCRSTGRQDSLRAYYDREAILGRDDRGGAMALLISTERALWMAER